MSYMSNDAHMAFKDWFLNENHLDPTLTPKVAMRAAFVAGWKTHDEKETQNIHLKIRADYDKTIVDAWRAEVEKRDAEIERLQKLLAEALDKLSP